MLDTAFKPTIPEKKEFDPLPPDVYQCELIEVKMGERTKYQSDEMEPTIEFTFALIEDTDFYGRRVWRTTNIKLVGGEKPSNLYGVLCGILGKQLTNEESLTIDGKFINELEGRQVRLALEHYVTQKGKTINKIASYLPVKQMLPKFDSEKSKKMAEKFQLKNNLKDINPGAPQEGEIDPESIPF